MGPGGTEEQMMSGARADVGAGRGARLLLLLVLVGAAVSVSLGVYGRVHPPSGRAITTFGFPTMLDMKASLATAGLALGVVQVLTALRMFGRIGHGPSPRAVTLTHRISGAAAVTLTLPVAFHCLWALGFGTSGPRVLVHSFAGCLFYGVFVTKMLALRAPGVPGWAVPLLGGTLFTVLVVTWLTSSLWFFTNGPIAY